MKKSVIFWRKERWCVGWLLDQQTTEGYQVGWLEDGRVFFKTVQHVIHIDVPAVDVMTRGNES